MRAGQKHKAVSMSLTYQKPLPNQAGQLERQAETSPEAQAHQTADEAQHGESQRRRVLWVGHELLVVLSNTNNR